MQREQNGILATVVCLVALGIVMVFSSSATVASEVERFGGDPCFFLKRQVLWAGVALAALALFARVDYHRWERLAFPLFLLTAFCLLLVLIPGVGRIANGSRRWLRRGPVNFQPSEMAKITLLLYCAVWASQGGDRFASFRRGFLPAVAVLGLVCGMVIVEPDMGMALFLGGLGMAVYLMAGARWRHIVLVCAPALIVGVLVFARHFEYVRARFGVWLDPALDPLGKGHQLMQSEIAIGSGGLTGVGLGQSRLKLFFLPERHTDFIFAIVGEELGFLGTAAVVGAFVVLLVLGWRICRRAPDRLGLLLSAGALVSIIGQAAVNMAVVTGLLPTKGIALPFVSYGGSSLVVSCAAAGLLLGVARAAAKAEPAAPPVAVAEAVPGPVLAGAAAVAGGGQ